MKKKYLFIASTLIVLSSFSQHATADEACTHTKHIYNSKEGLPLLETEEVINTNTPLFPNGEIHCLISGAFSLDVPRNKRLRLEEGKFKGLNYSINYEKGHLYLQGVEDEDPNKRKSSWQTMCVKDGFNDITSCYLTKDYLAIKTTGSVDDYTIGITADNILANSNFTIRVDDNKPVSTSHASGVKNNSSEQLIKQLKAGENVLTRYQEWSNGHNVDYKTSLFGFNEALEMLPVMFEYTDVK